ncbi:ABC transporter ATP-binding protein [Solitalea lacus]|uniref:ABC transporter ATP-binding protein n=1 Tax=Solitalea lacus TaxID=2911172 RepID=UPI001EDC60D6|nr:ABC transporter ATP-binding protein [Solitalea lacus]UKJ07967.1 ABC transporter ATP-binding protein [Solitalea lacus]
MIEVVNVSKHFGKLHALNGINLKLNQGECIALVGPNGCGKTTLIKTILGMVIPDEGSINFAGKNIKNDNEYRRNIGYMPQIGRYPENMSIGHVLDMIKGIRSYNKPLDNELYEKFEIGSMVGKKMRTLSSGTTQKVSATLAFLFHPQVLILDEPTAGLDPIASEILKEKIIAEKNKGRLILITSHLLSELEGIVSQIIFMQDGNLVLHKNVEELKSGTGKRTIASAILQLLKTEN